MDTPQKKKVFCRFLKAKNSFGMLEGGDNHWFEIADASTQFWCVKSTGGAGPDNDFVSPGKCVKGRICFQD